MFVVGKILPQTAAAGSKVHAAWCNCLRGILEQLHHPSLGVGCLFAGDPDKDTLTWNGAIDEDDKAINPGQALTTKGKVFHHQFDFGAFFQFGHFLFQLSAFSIQQ